MIPFFVGVFGGLFVVVGAGLYVWQRIRAAEARDPPSSGAYWRMSVTASMRAARRAGM